MFSKILVFLLISWIGVVKLDVIVFNDCGYYTLTQVTIQDCTATDCSLVLGHDYAVTIAFQSTLSSQLLLQEVYINILGVNTKLTVTPANPCDKVSCPIVESETNVLAAVMTINPNLIAMSGELWWSVKNEAGDEVICMKTNVNVI